MNVARVPLGPLARETTGRLHVLVVLAAAVGITTGASVAAFDWVVRSNGFDRLLTLPLWAVASAPVVALVVAGVLTTRLARGDGATTDAYITAYHRKGGALPGRALAARIVACGASLAGGAALGYEGPAILLGATFGSLGERRVAARWRSDDAKVLLVAGAAAGVAAVFKAPLTGIVFALEVPYTQDLARRALLPALVAASASYLTFVTLFGTAPVLTIQGSAPFDLRDLAGGLVVGLLGGLLARWGAWAVIRAKQLPLRLAWRAPLAGLGLAGLAVLTAHLYGSPLGLGAGYRSIEWARLHPDALWLLAALFALRFAATWCSVAGGGVGGLFIPLVTQGALLGQTIQAVVHAPNPGLLPTLGIAAVLGAGYRTPLAGVAFVAEATGQPGFVVPALLAAAAAQLTIGNRSFSPYQRRQRQPAIAPTGEIAIDDVMTPNPDTVAADTPLDRAVATMMAANRRWVPVVAGGRYVGMLALADAAAHPSGAWPGLRAGEVARPAPTVELGSSVAEAAALIRSGPVGAVAITDGEAVVGVLSERDVTDIERVLEALAPEETGPHHLPVRASLETEVGSGSTPHSDRRRWGR